MTIQRTPGSPVAPPSPTTPTEPKPTPAPSAAAVKEAEKLLKLAGFETGKVDGKPSAATTQALKDFQAAWGMPSTGQLDDKTLAKLRHTGERIQKHAKAKDEFVSVGQRSNSIKTLEQRLKKLGYNTGKADGTFDRDTAKAVQAFRKDQKELDDKSGALAKGSRAVLRREAAALDHAPERRRLAPSTQQSRLDRQTAQAAAKKHADGTVGFGVGSQGNSIKNLQSRLKAAGFDPKHTTGKFDERTEGALKAFQRKSGLEATGRADAKTWKALQKSFILSKKAAGPAQDVGERSRAVLHSEKLLKKLGFNPGKVDGLFDRNTQKASQRFEKKYGGGKDGAIGEAQLKKMEAVARQREGKKVDGYVNGVRRTITVKKVPGGKYMRSDAAAAFNRMHAAAKKAGITLTVNSGFRSMAEQRALYAAYLNGTGNLAAKPGYSNHQGGIAVDINVGTTATSTYRWLANNAAKFGFKRTVPSEAWHWEYRP